MLAEGNIYDSGIDAVRLRFGDVVKYSLLYGRADVVRENKLYVATASYKDYDYDVALGWHRVDYDEGVPGDNTIWTAGGNYAFGGDFGFDHTIGGTRRSAASIRQLGHRRNAAQSTTGTVRCAGQ